MGVQRYQAKHFECEAIQWDGTNLDEIAEWTGPARDFEVPEGHVGPSGIMMEHPGTEPLVTVWDYLQHCWVPVNDGDFIIKGMKGEFYPCDADVFNAKYEVMP